MSGVVYLLPYTLSLRGQGQVLLSLLLLLGPPPPPGIRMKIFMEMVMVVMMIKHTDVTFRAPRIVIYSYNRSQQDALFLNFILIYNSTCFGQTYCPSTVVLILNTEAERKHVR
jgi:hypothetical protein